VVRETLVFILAGGKGNRLMPLTRYRSKPAVPFGSQYRIIDFTVSNCINSGLRRIYVLTQYKSNSLAWHVRYAYGHHFVPEAGHFLTTVPPQQLTSEDWYRGTADAVYQNFQFLQAIAPRFALILAGDHVYKMNYGSLIEFHASRAAHVTVAVVETPIDRARKQFGVLELDEDGRVVSFVEKPEDPVPTPHNPRTCFSSMGIYVFNTDVLEDVLVEDAHDPESGHDFGRDILPRIHKSLRVFGYSFIDSATGAPCYWRDVGTLEQYYDANIDLITPLPALNLYDPTWPIYTYTQPLPAAKFVLADDWGSARTGHAINSLVSNGCIISGATVVGSVISPDVRIDEYSTVANSIVMSGARIGKHVRIVRAIVDKGAVIPDGSVLEAGNVAFNDDYDVTESGIVVVPKKMAVSRIHGRRLRADGTAPAGDGPLGRILVVDDDKSIRMILEEVLEERGYLVYTAEDGPSAVRVAEGKPLDLAFVDIVMAPMEGAEVIQELRRVNPGLRVVVVTSLTDDERLERARALGIADCIYKPFDLRAVVAATRRLIKPPPPPPAEVKI